MVILALVLCACSEVPGKLFVMEGNSRSSRGQYNQAIESYMRAMEFTEAGLYGEYALGAVFFALGEDNAALDRFSNARQMLENSPAGSNRELRYRIHYNTAVVLFSAGDFSGAADYFREALRIDGSRIEAKRNLELSLLSLERENVLNVLRESIGENDAENESRAAFFEFIRQRELTQWRNREWPEEDNITGPDY